MSRFRTLLLASAALVVAACSDTQSPSTPADPSDANEMTFVLDQSSASATVEDESASGEGSGKLGTGGRGARKSVQTEAVSCVENRLHALCLDIRRGVLRAAAADAIVNRNNRSTRGQLRINGFLVEVTNRFGPNFVGDEIFANYPPNLGWRVFRGDRVCHQFPGATPQICGTLR